MLLGRCSVVFGAGSFYIRLSDEAAWKVGGVSILDNEI